MSRASVYETIEEELSSSTSSSSAQPLNESPACQQVFTVDSDTASVHSRPDEVTWHDEHGIVALRKFYALLDEAVETVTESKRMGWTVQCGCSLSIPIRHTNELSAFQAPNHPAGMQALLEHSVQNYGPLPSRLRPRRVRSCTSSRPTPYPSNRFIKITTISPEKMTAPVTEVRVPLPHQPCVKFPSIPTRCSSRQISTLSSLFHPCPLISSPSARTRSDLRSMSDLVWDLRRAGRLSDGRNEILANPRRIRRRT